MTLDQELRDLAIYLKDCDSDSAAAICERAREAMRELMHACDSWDRGFAEGDQFTPEQFRVWVNERRQLCRTALAAAGADR